MDAWPCHNNHIGGNNIATNCKKKYKEKKNYRKALNKHQKRLKRLLISWGNKAKT